MEPDQSFCERVYGHIHRIGGFLRASEEGYFQDFL